MEKTTNALKSNRIKAKHVEGEVWVTETKEKENFFSGTFSFLFT